MFMYLVFGSAYMAYTYLFNGYSELTKACVLQIPVRVTEWLYISQNLLDLWKF